MDAGRRSQGCAGLPCAMPVSRIKLRARQRASPCARRWLPAHTASCSRTWRRGWRRWAACPCSAAQARLRRSRCTRCTSSETCPSHGQVTDGKKGAVVVGLASFARRARSRQSAWIDRDGWRACIPEARCCGSRACLVCAYPPLAAAARRACARRSLAQGQPRASPFLTPGCPHPAFFVCSKAHECLPPAALQALAAREAGSSSPQDPPEQQAAAASPPQLEALLGPSPQLEELPREPPLPQLASPAARSLDSRAQRVQQAQPPAAPAVGRAAQRQEGASGGGSPRGAAVAPPTASAQPPRVRHYHRRPRMRQLYIAALSMHLAVLALDSAVGGPLHRVRPGARSARGVAGAGRARPWPASARRQRRAFELGCASADAARRHPPAPPSSPRSRAPRPRRARRPLRLPRCRRASRPCWCFPACRACGAWGQVAAGWGSAACFFRRACTCACAAPTPCPYSRLSRTPSATPCRRRRVWRWPLLAVAVAVTAEHLSQQLHAPAGLACRVVALSTSVGWLRSWGWLGVVGSELACCAMLGRASGALLPPLRRC